MEEKYYKELPCRRCGHVWKWALDKKTDPHCPKGHGCMKDVSEEAMSLTSKAQAYDVLVRELFVLLDRTEESDEGRVFRPNKFYSCRALDAEKLEKVLDDLKKTLEDRR